MQMPIIIWGFLIFKKEILTPQKSALTKPLLFIKN